MTRFTKTLLALATLTVLAVPAASMAEPGRFHRDFDYRVAWRADVPRPYMRPRFFPAFTPRYERVDHRRFFEERRHRFF